jgi:hypothetical protein
MNHPTLLPGWGGSYMLSLKGVTMKIYFPVTSAEVTRILAQPPQDLLAQARNHPLRRITRDIIPDQAAAAK